MEGRSLLHVGAPRRIDGAEDQVDSRKGVTMSTADFRAARYAITRVKEAIRGSAWDCQRDLAGSAAFIICRNELTKVGRVTRVRRCEFGLIVAGVRRMVSGRPWIAVGTWVGE